MLDFLSQRRKVILKISFIVAIGGLLNGFMTAIMAGILPIIRNEWSLSSNQQEWLISFALIGAVVGAFFSARTINKIGRKNTILISSVIFAIGSVLCAISNSIPWFLVSRGILGIAVGMSSYTIPMYITEISPNRNRSALLTLNQLMVTLGILFAYVNSLTLLSTEHNWRWMAFIGFIPAVMLYVGMSFLPRSPKWLIIKGRFANARTALLKIEEPEKIELMMDMIIQEVDTERSLDMRWRNMFRSNYLRIMLVSIAIMFFQQCTGINIFVYYSPMLFEIAGFNSLQACLAGAIALGLVNVLCTVVSINLIENLGRKTLYFIGLLGMTLALFVLSFSFLNYEFQGYYFKWIVFGSSILFIICFAIGIGPLAWLLTTEIFPTRIRSVGLSISIIFNWIFNFCTIFTFFKISKGISFAGHEFIIQESNKGIVDIFFNPGINFFIYGLLCIVGIVFGYYFLPETKGMSSLDIADFWEKKNDKMKYR